jgi:RHS repeat-associated protein
MTKIQGDRDSVFLYTGDFWHAPSGLDLTENRAYDPNLGRWISPDPIAEGGGENYYTYVGNNPINFMDPLGLFCWSDVWNKFWHSWAVPIAAGASGAALGVGLALAPEISIPVLVGEAWAAWAASGTAAAAGAAEETAEDALGEIGSTPIGRSGNPMDVSPGTNLADTINGIDYSGHALDQMQGRGIMPSVVENALQNGTKLPGNMPGTSVVYDSVNNVSVVINNTTGKVITVIPGAR